MTVREIARQAGVSAATVSRYFTGTEKVSEDVRCKIDPIDATGAGDAFNAGFIYGLYHNYDIRTCIAMGNRMGGACVSKVGCLSGYLTEEQLLREFQASNSSC